MKIQKADISSSAGTNVQQRTEADNSTSASLLPNQVLAEVKKTDFSLNDVLRLISLTYNLSRKGEFIGDEWLYEYPYYDDILDKIKSGGNFC